MLAEKVATGESNLIDKLWEHIQQRTWRRLRDVEIAIEEGRLTVRGVAPTFYVKQLALRAICDVMGAAPVAIQINVETEAPPVQLYEVLAG